MARLLVTGAAGYLGSWIVKTLLDEGHEVRGSVRDLHDQDKTRHLQALARQHPGRLHLFEADLLRPGSFDAAAAQCEIIIHCASPYRLQGWADAQKELIEPAVRGTEQVLQAATRSASVRRIVLTSSIVACSASHAETQQQHGGVLSEAAWNASSQLKVDPYALSKTQAERRAWALVEQQSRWDLVTLNPGAIFGPSLSFRVDAESVAMMRQFARGQFRSGVPDLQLGIVDVRDVALAHARAALRSQAQGRHVLVAEPRTLLELGETLAMLAPTLKPQLPRRTLPAWLIWLLGPMVGLSRRFVQDNVGLRTQYANAKSRDALGLRYRPVEETLADHLQQLQRDGLLMP